MMKPCHICKKMTDGHIIQEWGEVNNLYPKRALFIDKQKNPLQDDDLVGLPICVDCYHFEFEE